MAINNSLYTAHGNQCSHFEAHGCKKDLNAQTTNSPLFDQLGDRLQHNMPTPDIVLKVKEDSGNLSMLENESIDAGWTYFGQFISHDLTVGRAMGISTPRLNLDALYGFGPNSNGHLYETDKDPNSEYAFRGVRFLLDPYFNKIGEPVYDVPRVGTLKSMPLMGDVRNDENFLLSQLHCTFMRFHNRMAEFFYRKTHWSQSELFQRTRQFVTKTYQWLIVNEYLKKLTGNIPSMLIEGHQNFKILQKGDRFAQPPILMPEFIAAAFRMGHSQVRAFYKINRLSKELAIHHDQFPEIVDLRGFIRDDRRGPVDWRMLFTFDQKHKVTKSRPIDLIIAPPMSHLPFFDQDNEQIDLIKTNIYKSIDSNLILWEKDLKMLEERLGISTIQNFAQALEQLVLFPDHPYFVAWNKCKENLISLNGWPLWIFLLLEARVKGVENPNEQQDISKDVKQKLGPLGAQIIAEQIIWILRKDEASYLQHETPWNPMKELFDSYRPIGDDTSDSFSILDVINIAQNGIYS